MDILRRLVELHDGGESCVLATVVRVTGSAPRHEGARMLVRPGGRSEGTVGGGEVEERSRDAAEEMLASGEPAHRMLEVPTQCGGRVEVHLELFGIPRRLVVVGGGHVGAAVARLAASVGYRVTVVDPHGAPRLDDEPGVEVVVSGDPAVLEEMAPGGTQVMVATGNREDDARWAVEALRRGFAGAGVIGSSSKARVIRRAVEEAGLDPGLLRCPVGLDIGSETPEEVAVSVVAELIALDRSAGDTGE